MRYRRGLILLAALTMTAGCGPTEPTTQTSMLRGPTPSSGMSIAPLLVVPDATTSDEPPAGADAPIPAQTADPAATPTEESLAPSSDTPVPADPLTEATDQVLPTDQPDATATGDTGTVDPALSALAARISCQDYIDESPDPLATGTGSCVLDDQNVLLYSFSTDQAAADYAATLTSSGVTSDQFVQGPGYVIEADPGPIAKIKAALGAG